MTKLPAATLLLALPSLVLGCDPEPAPDGIPRLDVASRGALVHCARGTYDLEQMNETLRTYPELADAIGIGRVDTCDDAPAYLAAVADYVESFPSEALADGADEGGFRIAYAEESNLVRPGVLEVRNKCTGVLIHERALITAAHCVADLAPTSGEKNFWAYNFDIDNYGGGSYLAGLVRLRQKRAKTFEGGAGEPFNNTVTVAQARDGRVFAGRLGSQGGLSWLNPGDDRLALEAAPFDRMWVSSCYPANDGRSTVA